MPAASDILLMVGYFALPEIFRALLRMASDSIIAHYWLGLCAMLLYPCFCVSMAQLAATDARIQEGLEFFQGQLWRLFTWPLGIIFYIALLFHGTWMWMGSLWGNFVFGDNFYELLFPGKNYDIWKDPFIISAYLLQYGISVWLVKRLWQISLQDYIPQDSVGWVLFVVFLPLYAAIIVPLVFVLPPYLAAVTWAYMLVRASKKEKPLIALIHQTRKTTAYAQVFLLVYGVLLGYFFQTAIEIAAREQTNNSIEKWMAVFVLFFVFYLPYRLFMAMYNQKSIYGWFIFIVSLAMVCYDLYIRFAV